MSSNGDHHDADVIMPSQHVELADVDAVESEFRSTESSSRSQSLPPPPPSTETMADQLFTVENDSVSFVSAPPTSATPSESVLTSRSPSPPPKAGPSTNKKKKKAAPLPVQLIDNLPIAREDALRTFTEMKENWYQSQRLGLSGEILEGSMCDCVYKHGRDEPYEACGHNSNCINRLTQVECLPGDCRCKEYCQNQRFQNGQYANIQVVLTEKKGYGLRAEEDLPRDTFIYEYIGDLVNSKVFKRRMREYAEEGIRHFYFMMLQKDEFIDATKNGGIGRFANHSCNPNCYVAKWTIGTRVRMGIFAKRNIKQWEELTFDYNVDRYGHDAQICYCGEPQCVGFIGGKTQTVSDDTLAALGLDEDDQTEYKVTKRKKAKDLDNMPTTALRPVLMKEVPKVIQAIRQNISRPKLLYKFLTRVKMTEDQATLRQIMRLRGMTLMKSILEESLGLPSVKEDDEGTPPAPSPPNPELICATLECLMTWPLMNRNKVEDSQLDTPLGKCIESPPNDTVKDLAEKLKSQWDLLEVAYRIPKRTQEEREADTEERTQSLFDSTRERTPPTLKRIRYEKEMPVGHSYKGLLPKGQGRRFNGSYRPAETFFPDPARQAAIERVERERRARLEKERNVQLEHMRARQSSAMDILEKMKAEAAHEEQEKLRLEEERKANEEEKKVQDELKRLQRERKEAERKRKKEEKDKLRAERRKTRDTPDQREANKEKRLLKLVGAVVVKVMSKHANVMEHDTFKKHAKELTQLIADKEKKSSSYRDNKLDALSEEKVGKIKKFAREYIGKVLKKLEKTGKLKAKPSGEPGPSSAGTAAPEMSVEEAMDMDAESDGMDDEDGDGDGDREMGDDGDGDGDGDGDTNMLPSMVRPPDSESPMDVDPPPYEVLAHRAGAILDIKES